MKVKLISMGRLPWYRKGERLFFFYTPRLGLPCIAAVTPPEWQVEILDGVKMADIDFDASVDLVGFSVLTPFANETYQAASLYRKRGVKVVMGGVHPTLVPKEAKAHADSVVVGEGEEIWPQLLKDVERNELQEFYAQKTPVDFASLPSPQYSLLKSEDYFVAHGIQLVRGCPYGRECRFCVVPKLFGTSYRVMPIEKALAEIKQSAASQNPRGVNLSACCALNHTDYLHSLAKAIEPLSIKWCGGGLLHRLDDEHFVKLLKRSGCEFVYTESEVVSPTKDHQKFETYVRVARMIHDNGMAISYNFTIGFDDDSRTVIDDVMSFIEKGHLNREYCAIQLFAPWPNTETHRELENAGRILDRDWAHYDNTRVVFRPERMTVEELESLYSSCRPR